VLAYLAQQTYPIEHVVIVADGFQLNPEDIDLQLSPTIVSIPKHEPGREQPRNVGVRFLLDSCKYVWFCDSDIIMAEDALEEIAKCIDSNPDGLVYGPYDWMSPGQRLPQWDLENDPRWEMFRQFSHEDIHVNSLGVALGCFSGNLLWNIEQFKRVGGFWNDLHAGRCEDGELGIRACAMGVPMSLNKKARGWHVYHDVDIRKIQEKNSRDVPMINERHPYIEQEGIIIEDQDGKRFAQLCETCGEAINTLEYWKHVEEHAQ
jgi:GT2 family glycosyltransferase